MQLVAEVERIEKNPILYVLKIHGQIRETI